MGSESCGCPVHPGRKFLTGGNFGERGNARFDPSLSVQTESNCRRARLLQEKRCKAAQGTQGAGQTVLPRTGRPSARDPRHPPAAVSATTPPQGWHDEVASTRDTASKTLSPSQAPSASATAHAGSSDRNPQPSPPWYSACSQMDTSSVLRAVPVSLAPKAALGLSALAFAVPLGFGVAAAAALASPTAVAR